MPDLFVEIGTEEIPAGYIEPALEDMGRKLVAFFEKGRVSAGTPRRGRWIGAPCLGRVRGL